MEFYLVPKANAGNSRVGEDEMQNYAVGGVAVVTGGNSGIGMACCRELLARGATVAVVDLNLRGLADLPGRPVHGWAADIADETAMERCAKEIEDSLGPVTVVVNSAGIIQNPERPHAMALSRWDEIVRVDQRGTFVACTVLGRRMVARRQGSLINIASIAGMRSVPLHGYGPAKAAVIAMTACLAAEWGPANVRVNAVSPGYTRTPALCDAIDKGERSPAALIGNAALKRLVEPEEVARTVGFLASEESSGITGANIPVDCGWLVASPWQTYGGLRDAE